MNVNTTMVSGRTHHRMVDNELYKDDDKKLAFVTLRREAHLTICFTYFSSVCHTKRI